MKDWADDPDAREWLEHAQRELPAKIRDSAIVCNLVPRGEPDAKYAVELGMSIMLDKPIMLVAVPGTRIPAKLAAIADLIVEADITTVAGKDQLQAALDEFLKKRGLE